MSMRVGIYGPSDGVSKEPTFKEGAFRYMSITPHRNARLISHPVENGSVRFDNKVIEPMTVTVVGYVYASDSETQNRLEKLQKRREWGFFSIVGFGNRRYDDMELLSVSNPQRAENPDSFEYTLNFQEVLLVQGQEMPMSSIPDDLPTLKS